MNDSSADTAKTEATRKKAPARRAAADPVRRAEAQPPPPKGLAAKMAETQLAIDGVPRSGRADMGQYSYDYATENDLMNAVRGELAKRGVAIYVSWVRAEMQGTLTTVYGEMRFVDSESGEREVIGMIGTGADRGDKGIYKAMTGANRYALWKTFLIPTGDEPDADHQDAEPGGAAAKPNAAVEKKRGLSSGHRQSIQTCLRKIDEVRGVAPGTSELSWGKAAAEKYGVGSWMDIPFDRGESILESLSARLLAEQTKAAEKAADSPSPAAETPGVERAAPGPATPQEGADDALGGAVKDELARAAGEDDLSDVPFS